MKKQTHKSLDIDFVEIIENSFKLAIEKSNEELMKKRCLKHWVP